MKVIESPNTRKKNTSSIKMNVRSKVTSNNGAIEIMNVKYAFTRRRSTLMARITDFQNGFRFNIRYPKNAKDKPPKTAYNGSTP